MPHKPLRPRSHRTQDAPESGGRGEPSLAELEALKRLICEVAGETSADEVLFQVGLNWGQHEAEVQGQGPLAGLDDRLRIERGLQRAAELGLGRVELDEFELARERKHFRVTGRLEDVPRLDGVGCEAPASAAQSCGLSLGFLTGMAASLTDLDLVCTPGKPRDPQAWPFEIHPAHTQAVGPGGAHPPAGSARFYLGAMGRALAAEDIALDDLLENTSDALILIDSEDLIRFWNRGAERMFGYGREEVVGRRIGFLLPSDLREQDELGQLRALLETEGPVQNRVTRRVRKDGVELWVSLTRTVLHDRRGRSVGSTATIRDITQQRRTEEELYHARGLAMLGEFSAKIAHELKNPLTGIYAAVQLLARGVDPDDSLRAVYDDLGGEVRRLNETVQDLLRFAHPLPPRPQPTDLRSFVLDLLTPMRLLPEMAEHQLQVSIEEGLVVALDTRLLGQVISNLVLNATQAMDKPGIIAIVAVQAVDHVVIDVSDTGRGIPAEQRQGIFEPFFTTKARGSGLGLAIARKNVEAHGGTLQLEEQEGPGSRFRIALPCDCRSAHPAGSITR